MSENMRLGPDTPVEMSVSVGGEGGAQGRTIVHQTTIGALGVNTKAEEAPAAPAKEIQSVMNDESLSPEARAMKVDELSKAHLDAVCAWKKTGGVAILDGVQQAVVKYINDQKKEGDTWNIQDEHLQITQIPAQTGLKLTITGTAVYGS